MVKNLKPSTEIRGEKLFRLEVMEHNGMVYEVWARDSSEAIKNFKKGHGFGFQLTKDIAVQSCEEVLGTDEDE